MTKTVTSSIASAKPTKPNINRSAPPKRRCSEIWSPPIGAPGRARRFEVGFFAKQSFDLSRSEENYSSFSTHSRLSIIVDNDSKSADTLVKNLRYEVNLERSFYKALNELRRTQSVARRRIRILRKQTQLPDEPGPGPQLVPTTRRARAIHFRYTGQFTLVPDQPNRNSAAAALPIAILFLLCVGFYWKLVLTDQYVWFDHPDMCYIEIPRLEFQAREIHASHFPLWDSALWMGQPKAHYSH